MFFIFILAPEYFKISMSASTTILSSSKTDDLWGGGKKPMNVSYGKLMIWFFILSDALTFSAFLVSYGFTRFKFIDSWPISDEVFTHFPFLHGDYPMLYVAFMTFVLIASSVTMVLAVDAGHQMKKNKVVFYMLLTIIGGAIFLGSQAWEWTHFIHGTQGAMKLKDNSIVHVVKEKRLKGKKMLYEKIPIPELVGVEAHSRDPIFISHIKDAFSEDSELKLRAGNSKIYQHSESLKLFDNIEKVVRGSNLIENEFGKSTFANFFFFITGFHGFHVFSGIILNIIIFINVVLGTYDRKGHYEMVEKSGLYWHFVDLVWVFVFTFFYLV